MQVVDIHSRAGDAKGIVENEIDYIQRLWMKSGVFFETRLLEYIYWHYKGGTFVDIGSNIGNHTLFFAKFCGARHVISVEPQADVVKFQRKVLELNGVYKRVTIHECAVSDKAGRGSIRPWDKNPAYVWAAGQLVEGDDVRVTTIDDILLDVRNINVLKIDVEMKEMEVLAGAIDTLTHKKPAIFLEIKHKSTYHKVKDFMRPLGYRQVGSHFQGGQVFEFTVHADETEISHLA